MTEPREADVASLAAGLGTALHAAGLPVGPDRCERLARAVTVMDARTTGDLHACALATMVSDPGQVAVFERVFAMLLGGPAPFPAMPAAASQAAGEVVRQDTAADTGDGAAQQGAASLTSGLLRQVTGIAGAAEGDGPEDEAAGAFRMASAAE
ncbi:MAG TPA: hypothetical protein VGG16_18345, partial [Streptosporangiaceae bacterium]